MKRNLVWGAAVALLMTLSLTAPAAAQNLPAEICQDLKDARKPLPADLTKLCAAAGDPACPLGAMLNAVAFRHPGWGLSRKESGFFIASPAGKVASDILESKADQLMYDVLRDGSGEAAVTCGATIGKGGRPFVDPVDPGGSPAPAPTPEPTPTPAPGVDLGPRVAALEANLAALRDYAAQLQGAIAALGDTLAAQRDALNNHEARLVVLESRKIPTSCSVPFLGCHLN
jgi:hypothetical protein